MRTTSGTTSMPSSAARSGVRSAVLSVTMATTAGNCRGAPCLQSSYMNALARFEGFMQAVMDRRVVRLLGGTLQPVELAQAMARSMEAERSGTEAPNRFRLLLHPEDYADMRVLDSELERKLGQYAVELARERGLNFPAAPEVSLAADGSVERGAVRVEATTVGPAPAAGTESPWRRPSRSTG